MSVKKRFVYECDGCGIEIEPKVRIQIQIYGEHSGIKMFKTEESCDFCEECSQKVMTFIRGLQQKGGVE